MGFAPGGASIGEEIGDGVVGAFDVLGCQAVGGGGHDGAKFASHKLDGRVGDRVGVDAARFE